MYSPGMLICFSFKIRFFSFFAHSFYVTWLNYCIEKKRERESTLIRKREEGRQAIFPLQFLLCFSGEVNVLHTPFSPLPHRHCVSDHTGIKVIQVNNIQTLKLMGAL